MKLCTVCGVTTSARDGRCGKHPRTSRQGASHAVHADPRWSRMSKRLIARHVGEHGYVCPGDGDDHPAHPSRDLTVDHVLALADGGAAFDPTNLRVLCRSRNSANGARLVNARRAPAVPRGARSDHSTPRSGREHGPLGIQAGPASGAEHAALAGEHARSDPQERPL